MIEMIEAVGTGLGNMFNPTVLAMIALGVLIGLVIGILPGIGDTATLAILLPVVFTLKPAVGLCFLLGIHAAASQGGVVTSILFGVPGETTTMATILDGHPMAQQGKAGRAIGASQMSSMLGALFGGFVLIFLTQVARPIVMAFGSPEMFMMAIVGISFVAVLGKQSPIKAFIAGGMGLMASFVGFHSGTGALRYTGGYLYFWEGLRIIPVLMGIFALPEIIELAVKGGSIAKVKEANVSFADVMDGIKDVFKNWFLLIRCSAMGTAMGLIPGIGGAVSQFICYGYAKTASKRPQEFGLGCVEGVIAPESGNNAREGGSLFTALALGLPSGAPMVMILAALVVVGIKPGPDMLSKNLPLFWTLIGALVFGNILASTSCILGAKKLAQITFIKGVILVPLIILFVVLGTYGAAYEIKDVPAAFVAGGVGYLMKICGYSRITFTIGFVLGEIAERYFILSVISLGPGFLLISPIAAGLGLLVVVAVVGRSAKRVYRILFPTGKEEEESE